MTCADKGTLTDQARKVKAADSLWPNRGVCIRFEWLFKLLSFLNCTVSVVLALNQIKESDSSLG